MIKDSRFRNGLLLFLLTSSFLLPSFVMAQNKAAPTEYKLLEPIPQLVKAGTEGKTDTATFIPGLFKLVIALAGALAVIMIIYGGIQYMSTDAIGGKSDAKKTIENALWGLLLALSAYMILYTLNPKLLEFNLDIPVQTIATSTISNNGGPLVLAPVCPNCVVIKVPHKEAPAGCGLPGPCTINSDLNNKLITLDKMTDFYVTEMYPPTVHHNDPCHNSGTCVDATIASSNAQNIKKFLEDSSSAGLGGTFFEASTDKRRNDLINEGVPANRIIVTKGNGEHFHIK